MKLTVNFGYNALDWRELVPCHGSWRRLPDAPARSKTQRHLRNREERGQLVNELTRFPGNRISHLTEHETALERLVMIEPQGMMP